jgi:hypothetical protein
LTSALNLGGFCEGNHRWLREDLRIKSINPRVTGRPARGLRHRQLAFPFTAYGQQWKADS